MTTLTMPSSPGFKSRSWGLSANTQVFQSPLTNSVQTQNLTGSRWVSTWTLPPMKLADAANWFSFLVNLEGRSGRFYAVPPNNTPQGTATGVPVVNGASQTGSSLETNGWTPGVVVMKKGDFFKLANDELKMITSNVTSNGSGEATLPFKPGLRNSPADGSAIVTNNPSCIMMLTTDETQWDRDNFRLYGISFAGVETWAAS